MSEWTLEYDSEEKTLAEWGFALDGGTIELQNLAIDTLTLRGPAADPTTDPAIPFEGLIILRRGRTPAEGGGYEGGSIEFTGKRLLHLMHEDGHAGALVYHFGGPWYDIECSPYLQTVKTYAGGGTTTDVTHSDVTLFMRVTGPGTTELLNNGEQIDDVLDHILTTYAAQSMTAPFQIGTIEPAVDLNTYPMRDVKCSEVIRYCLRCSPDAVLWFDYSTTPPTVNVTKRASMTAVSKAYASVKMMSAELTPRYDLQARSVVLYFKSANTDDGYTWIETTKQKYPLDGVEAGLRVIVQTVDLVGYFRQDFTGSLTSQAITNNRTWWEQFVPELKSTRIRDFSVGTMTVKDEAGTTVSLTGKYMLIDGEWAPWMKIDNLTTPVTAQRVVISADAAYKQYDVEGTGTDGMVTRDVTKRTLDARVTITNSEPGTQAYSGISATMDAEEIPANLAQNIYQALAALQYQGSLRWVDEEVMTGVHPGQVLNITGARSEWTTMNAMIQQVTKDLGPGITTINIGPAVHLSAGDLTQLFLINRNRKWSDPGIMATAKASSASVSVGMGESIAKENTHAGTQDLKQLKIVGTETGGNRSVVNHDTTVSAQVQIVNVNSSGAKMGDEEIRLKLSEACGKEVALRWFYFKDSQDGCALKKMLVLSSEPEAG